MSYFDCMPIAVLYADCCILIVHCSMFWVDPPCPSTIVLRDWDTVGHKGTGTQCDITGLGHNGTGTQQDWDKMGHNGTGTQWDAMGLGHNGTQRDLSLIHI